MHIFFKIIGWSWIILGIYWFLRPNTIRRYFRKKSNKNLRRILIAAVFLLLGFFLSLKEFAANLWVKLLLILLFFAVIKVLFFAKSKMHGKILAWWDEQPVWFWRLYSAVFILLGFILIKW